MANLLMQLRESTKNLFGDRFEFEGIVAENQDTGVITYGNNNCWIDLILKKTGNVLDLNFYLTSCRGERKLVMSHPGDQDDYNKIIEMISYQKKNFEMGEGNEC